MAAPDGPAPAVTFDSLTATTVVGMMNKSMQRWNDMTDMYGKALEYDYIDSKNQPTKNQAAADRTESESGSGAARRMDYSTPSVINPVRAA